MQRPDIATLACVHAECQYFGRPAQGNLSIRKVYGKDGIRLLRCCQWVAFGDCYAPRGASR
jgi:hypothetical protein